MFSPVLYTCTYIYIYIHVSIIIHIQPFFFQLRDPEQDRRTYLTALNLLRDIYDKGFRIFWTHQNYYCEFTSKCRQERRTNCHEVSFVHFK